MLTEDRTIYAGTSVLIIVHVGFQFPAGRGEVGHVRSKSNELMEELEFQLGNMQAQLMNIRVSYHHSAFPELTNVEPPRSGLCQLQSRMETTATAAVARRFKNSAWSPRSKPSQNSLFPLMVEHWGDEKAIVMQRRISDSQAAMPRDIDCDSTSGEGALRTFRFEEQYPHGLPGCQRYLLGGKYTEPSNISGLSKSRCVQQVDGQQVSASTLYPPGHGVYYFGERALRTLAPNLMGDKSEMQVRPSMEQQADEDARHKDSRFWAWGSWF
jgi:hypothetical protein